MSLGTPEAKPDFKSALTVLSTLFFIWGFITSLNDILIPHLKSLFTLSYTQAMLIQFCFFGAYFIISVPSGLLVERIDYKGGIVLGLAIAGCACLLFYPAAALLSYNLFLGAFFLLAAGITLLQVAANPYVTALGEPETASSRLTLTQAFNSLGTTLGPYLGAVFILESAVKPVAEGITLNNEQLALYQASQAATVQYPYLFLALSLFIMAVGFAFLKLPKLAGLPAKSAAMISNKSEHAWQFRHLQMGALAIFVYVGAEVSIGSFMVNFFGQAEIAGLAEQEAGKYVSIYWGGAMLGRFLGAATMRKFRPDTVLTVHALLAAGLVLLSLFTQGFIAMWSLLAVGLCNSIMFPTLFSLALNGLGRHTGEGSGILCAAIVGGAILPVIQGLFADSIGIHHAFFLPVLCYLYIGFYALRWRYWSI
jgi:MFS transporter, FHS family, L-fucose permease